jgi:nicotinamidase-related amidase
VGEPTVTSRESRISVDSRPNTALLVIDMQVGVIARAHGREAVIANIRSLVDRARLNGAPVVWVQHHSEDLPRDSETWRIAPELAPDPAEPMVEKAYGDAFEDTRLETVLSGLGVGRLLVVGAQTDHCVRSTLHGALVRAYDAILVADVHTAGDLTMWGAPPPELVIAHTNLYWTDQSAPGRMAGTVKAADVDFTTQA